jgi:hypothetical protein
MTTSTLSTKDNSVIDSNLDANTQTSEHFYSLPSFDDNMVTHQACSHSNKDEQSTESPSLIVSNQTKYLLFEFFERSDNVFLCSLVSINRFCRPKLTVTFLFHMESIGAIVLVPHLIVGFPWHVMTRQLLSHVIMSRVWNRDQQFSNVDHVRWPYIRIIWMIWKWPMAI